jgi:hypothetical protein
MKLELAIAMCGLLAVSTGASAASPSPAAPATPVEHRIVNVATVACADLLGASQEDRAAAAMFYLGYGVAQLKLATVDVGYIEGLETAALDECARTPTRSASVVFARVLADAGKGSP